MYCDLIFTGKTFNGKKIYKCEKCGLEAGLEDPEAKIYCFIKNTELFQQKFMHQYTHEDNEENEIIKYNTEEQIVKDQQEQIEQQKSVLATQEQIKERMDICNKCQYYKDEACMLCGCRIVREKNYQNKLANKKASCPDGKWGPINT